MIRTSRIMGLFMLVIGMWLVSPHTNAQELQTQGKQVKGHALYKKSKLFDSNSGSTDSRPKAVGDRASDRLLYEFEMTRDPNTGQIPEDIRELELQFAAGIDDLQETAGNSKRGWSSYFWKNRGPFNVGGRTRALAIDRTNENVILAGGVSGGLWRSTDSGQTWKRVTKRNQLPSISCIIQDPRPGQGHVWYYGTGERSGNSASGGGAFYAGNGIFKSTNGGKTWELLASTADNLVGTFSPLDLISNIQIHPTTGDVYASTFNGVFRSVDGGASFTEVFEGGFDNWTDVMITPGGVIYVSQESTGLNPGIYTSTDGDTWTNITPASFPTAYGRTVFGYTPSNENVIYTLSQSFSSPGFLFRYDAAVDSVDLAWTDLSANLPFIGGPVGTLNTQGSYNLVVKVHPTNPDIVFVGGTNLYRSTTGFTTPAGQESWIAGYSPLNNVSLYTDQHPDQHALVFYPSNPDKALSGNDGGVFVTEDITAVEAGPEPVDWTSLNNGYLTTQPYTVAFDPESKEEDLISGFQDNGTWFTDSPDSDTPWVEDFGGDGSYNAIADGGNSRYVSSQFGNIYRLDFDDDGNFVSFARVTPAGASGFGFVAPFILDPINDNVMYLPAGNRIWRNNNLDELPLFSNAQPSTNWVELTNSTVPVGSITALDISRYPEPNRLYYGTNAGQIFRMDNANIDNQEVVDISAGLPGGFISNVAVDPNDDDNVFVIFSNYGIQSIFYSSDAGETWTDVSGNLEENADGTGNGPSVRWIAFLGRGNGYYVGTSTGLYYTWFLKGDRTYWRQVARRTIGNVVVPQVRTRKDGFVAAASHGNGLFSVKRFVRRSKEPRLKVVNFLDDYSTDINSADTSIYIGDVFDYKWSWWPINISVTNSNDSLVTANVVNDSLLISYAPDAEGVASIGLIAKTWRETVSEGFTISVSERPIYAQEEPRIGSRPSQFFPDFGGALAQTSADFDVPAGDTWTVESLIAAGAANNSPALTEAVVVIYEDNAGAPGAEIYNSGPIIPDSDPFDTNLNLALPAPLTLTDGGYWISVYVNLPFFPNGTQWFWGTQATVVGSEGFFRDQANLFGTGAINWTPASLAFGGAPSDQIFQLFGTIVPASAASKSADSKKQVIEKEDEVTETVPGYVTWPNPSSGVFNFRLSDVISDKAQIEVYNIDGAVVMQKTTFDARQVFQWNASNVPTGIYIVHLTTDGQKQMIKVIKK